MIFDKEAKTILWKKNKASSTSGSGIYVEECKLIHFLSPCTNLKFKWIKDLLIKSDTLNLTEEKVGKNLEHIGTGEIFQNRTPIVQVRRLTINKWDLIKLNNSCKAKATVNKTKQQPTERENIFSNPTSDRGSISNIYREFKPTKNGIQN